MEQKQEVLNRAGLLSRRQIENSKIIQFLNYLPVVDDIASKVNHQLLLKEFTATVFNSILEENFPWLANITHGDLINKIPTTTLQCSIAGALNICDTRYFMIIKIALERKQSGIPIETLKSIQFQVEYFQLVRSYCKHFNIDL